MNTHIFSISILLGLLTAANAASVVVNWSNNRALTTRGELADLSSGTPADGDGSLLQLGYFNMATPADPFAGKWAVLAVGTIGDQGDRGDGYFSMTSILAEGSLTTPAVGTPLGVRYFNGSSVATSTEYNTGVNVDGSGLWQPPADPAPVINVVFSKIATRFEDNPGAFETTIAIPEPSITLLAFLALGGLAMRRRAS